MLDGATASPNRFKPVSTGRSRVDGVLASFSTLWRPSRRGAASRNSVTVGMDYFLSFLYQNPVLSNLTPAILLLPAQCSPSTYRFAITKQVSSSYDRDSCANFHMIVNCLGAHCPLSCDF